MDAVAVVASIVLGASFVVAGASKLAAGKLWPAQARGLGAPVWAIPVVPWIELSLGGVLIAQLARVAAAAFGLAVLAAFTALIVARLREGRHPPCACFGAWSAKPLGPGHVVRNAALMAIAVLAIVG